MKPPLSVSNLTVGDLRNASGMEPPREKVEHLLTLKVMRLTRPTLVNSPIVTTELRDLSGSTINNFLKESCTNVPGAETIGAGQFMLLPQCFGNIYLGEVFSSYICVHNDSTQVAKNVTLKAILQTKPNSTVSANSPPVPTELLPGESVDDVFRYEVKQFGTHILTCEVSYNNPLFEEETMSFKKFFKFEVMTPLDLKTKVYTFETDVFVEAQVQNVTTGPLVLEKVALESADIFEVETLHSSQMIGDFESNIIGPKGSIQFLYRLLPKGNSIGKVKSIIATCIGKLDIVWRSNLGERGRLQSSQLTVEPPQYGDLRLQFEKLPSIVVLQKEYELGLRLSNTCDRLLELNLHLEDCPGFAWSTTSGQQIGKLRPGEDKLMSVRLIPIALGFQQISGLRLFDPYLCRDYDFDNATTALVINRKEPVT